MFNTVASQLQPHQPFRSPDASPKLSRPTRRRKNPHQRISDPSAAGTSSNPTLSYPPPTDVTRDQYRPPPFPVPWPDAPPNISPLGEPHPQQCTFKPIAQGALPTVHGPPSLWPATPPATSTITTEQDNSPPIVRSGSPYSPYRLLLSSNNVHEYAATLQGSDSAIPPNLWLKNPGRLDLMEYADEQTLILARAIHRVSSAEKAFVRKRLEETSVVRRAIAIRRLKDEFGKLPFNRAQQALAVARAAKQTVMAEKKLAAERVREAELRLKSAREALQMADSKLCNADQQVGQVMNTMNVQGLLTSLPVMINDDRARVNRTTNYRHPPPDSDSDSDDSWNSSDLSAFQSYYDAASSFGAKL